MRDDELEDILVVRFAVLHVASVDHFGTPWLHHVHRKKDAHFIKVIESYSNLFFSNLSAPLCVNHLQITDLSVLD